MKKIICVCLALLLCFPLFIGVGIALPSPYTKSYLGEFRYKHERLKNTTGKKLVLIGGSGVAFSYQTPLIERELGIKVVNYGLYAGLGSLAMMELALPHLKQGDIVVLTPELNREMLSDYFNPRYMWQAIDHSGLSPFQFSAEMRDCLLGDLPSYAMNKIHRLAQGGLSLQGIYQQSSFNEFGEISPQLYPNNILPLGYDPTMLADLHMPSTAYLEGVRNFVEEAKGVTVFYRISVVNQRAVVGNLEEYAEQLQALLPCKLLGNPADSVLPMEWFYDTNFHCNHAGAVVNSYRLIRQIKAELGDSSPTNVQLPTPPPMQYAPLEEGDQRHAHFFTYEQREEGWWIVGLTEEGKQQSALILPTHYNGEPICGYTQTALQGATELQELTVQHSLSLWDDSFQGCNQFRALHLRGLPNQFKVGEHLLRGSEAGIFVPQECYSQYVVDYSWARYANKIQKTH